MKNPREKDIFAIILYISFAACIFIPFFLLFPTHLFMQFPSKQRPCHHPYLYSRRDIRRSVHLQYTHTLRRLQLLIPSLLERLEYLHAFSYVYACIGSERERETKPTVCAFLNTFLHRHCSARARYYVSLNGGVSCFIEMRASSN